MSVDDTETRSLANTQVAWVKLGNDQESPEYRGMQALKGDPAGLQTLRSRNRILDVALHCQDPWA